MVRGVAVQKRVRRVKPTRGFTAAYIGVLKGGAREKDPAQRGLYIVVTARADGQLTRTWQHRFSFQGTNTFVVIGHFPDTSLERARRIVQEQREQLSQGIDPRRARPSRRPARTPPTLSAAAVGAEHAIETLAREFMELYVRPNRTDPSYVQGVLDRDVLPVWRGRDARTIKPREVIELLDGIVKRGSKVMANHTARILGQMFKYGIHRTIVEDSPVKLLVLPGGKEKPRDRALTDEELKAFLSDPLKCTRQPRLAIVIELLLLTAARRGELCAAKWAHVDLQAKTWHVPAENSKTEKAYTVPLSDKAVELFERLQKRAGRSAWVLPGTDPSKQLEPRLLTRGLAKCLKRFNAAGVKDFTLHDLRRTCRTGLARLKVEPHIAERILNHAAADRIIATYDVHDYAPQMRAALEKWAAHLKDLGHGTTA